MGVLVGSLKIPDIQREVNEEWVKKLSVSLQESYDVKGYYQLGRFHLCCYQGEFVFDRWSAQVQCFDEMGSFKYSYRICYRRGRNSGGYELFMQINASRPSVICRNSNHQLILNGLRRYFQSNYAVYLKTSRQPHRPIYN